MNNIFLKYLAYVLPIAYLLTTNRKFYLFGTFVHNGKFWSLYVLTVFLTTAYILYIEFIYCYLTLFRIEKRVKWSRTRKLTYFLLMGVGPIFVMNIALLYFAFLLVNQNLFASNYWTGGLFFFLGCFLSYALWVWNRPDKAILFGYMEMWVSSLIQRVTVESAVEKQGQARPESQQAISFKEIILLDILLVKSCRVGMTLYLRSGQQLHTRKKLWELVPRSDLRWFPEHQKGYRVNLAHITAVEEAKPQLQWTPALYESFIEQSQLNRYQVDNMLLINQAFLSQIEQESQLTAEWKKKALSRSIVIPLHWGE